MSDARFRSVLYCMRKVAMHRVAKLGWAGNDVGSRVSFTGLLLESLPPSTMRSTVSFWTTLALALFLLDVVAHPLLPGQQTALDICPNLKVTCVLDADWKHPIGSLGPKRASRVRHRIVPLSQCGSRSG